MASKILYTLVAAVGIGAASGAAWWYQNKATKPASADSPPLAQAAGAAPPGPVASGASAPRPIGVEVGKIELTKLIDEAQAVGSLRSRQSVIVRPEVSGRITQLNFRDGERVRKGQLLVQFDDQLPLAQVQQSLAELSIAQANHKRNQELVAQNFISQRSVDESAANLLVAQAKLALSRASAERLKLLAPFDGIAGIRTVNVGDYLKDGADVVNLEDIDAVYVDFRLPERFQTKVRRGQSANVELDALPGRKFTAVIQAIDPLIDVNGRSVGVRGCIDNRQLQLRPGMFARVNAVFGERINAMVIPEEAIVPQGARQFVVRLTDGPDGETKTTQRVEVRVGLRSPGRVEILSGLERNDVVVVAGHQRIQRDGTVVRVVDVSRGQGGGAGGNRGGREAAAGAAGAVGAASGASAAAGAAGSPTAGAAAARGAASGGVVVAGAQAGRGGPPGRAPQKAPSGPNPCTMDMTDDAATGGGRRGPPGGGEGGQRGPRNPA